MIFTFTPRGTITSVDSRLLRKLHKPLHCLVHRSLPAIMTHQSAEITMLYAEKVMKSGSHKWFEVTLTTGDGGGLSVHDIECTRR